MYLTLSKTQTPGFTVLKNQALFTLIRSMGGGEEKPKIFTFPLFHTSILCSMVPAAKIKQNKVTRKIYTTAAI